MAAAGSLLRLLWQCAVTGATPTGRHLHTSSWRADSSRASLTRVRRQTYARLYPVLLVKQDGSTIHIRYREPRRMLGENRRHRSISWCPPALPADACGPGRAVPGGEAGTIPETRGPAQREGAAARAC
ncbi:large ribosomal subunit protein mL55 isoform X1 [Equus przewalskii]|uniref:Large ribosomal subunit protein mL55 isoform X1 n=1 Tax=Equus przewalskii TaxID=9798 RepID=A0ABM4KHZ4_EQUPR|nr:39S ribosomal protein L55, mitochondrial isoform X1 [Equus caballus]XP_014586329.1 39S ribosomal protein L55, mitochondrial isoform X1 [Equus caballus]